MKKYIVRRDIPSIGRVSQEQWAERAARSNSVITELSPHLQWVESFICDHTAYCLYLATSADVVRRHSELMDCPAHNIEEIGKVIDPSHAATAGCDRARATYNAAADHYDAPPLEFWNRAGRRTVEAMRLSDGFHVLDVGCGAGASALHAAEHVGPNGRVLGIDLAESLLAVARTKAAARMLQNVQFRVGDMTALGFPDAHFDAVVCVFAVFFVPEMPALVRELWRMVRPSGQLAITTWGPRAFEPAASLWWQAVQTQRPDLHTEFNPWDSINDAASLHMLFHDAGIPEPKIAVAEDRQPLNEVEDWWTIVLGSGFRWTIEQLGPDAAQRVRDATLARMREQAVSHVECNTLHAIATKAG
ncbi:MAG: DUF4242 domain-containing protein [Phycisphaerales bacterium]|nr:DUF4242 domain-containing protein [Phycisphaerales bacterium]